MLVYRRSPLWSLVSLVVFLGAAGVAALKISGALHSADRVQSQARRLDQLSQGKLGSSLVLGSNLGRAVRQVRARIGPRGRLLQVTVNQSSAEFQYLVGQRAAGWLETSEMPSLQPEQVTLTGNGSPAGQAFALSVVRADVPQHLVGAIKRRPGLSDFQLSSARLSRSPLDNHLQWVVAGTGGGRDVVYSARPTGGGLKRIS